MSQEDDLPIFIRRHLGSVWALEILLLLRREPRRPWTLAEIVQELRAADALVSASLARFEKQGLAVLEATSMYSYRPASPDIATLCDAAEVAFRERPVATINLISAPEDRLQKLADAFRIRRTRP
jgi:predicted transcriptional regulator